MTAGLPDGLAGGLTIARDTGGLTIAISTIGTRLTGMILPPPTPDCVVLVLAQEMSADAVPDAAPDVGLTGSENRADLRLIALPGRGVAASRNAALACADTDFLLFGDDDVTLNMGAVLQMRAHLAADPGQAMVVGHLSGPDRPDPPRPDPPRTEPLRTGPLRPGNAGRVGTPALMIRLAPFRSRGLRFDERFGLGASYPLGEEFIFVTDALQAGLRGSWLPVLVGHHPGPSSGANWADPVALRARAAALHRVFGARVLPYALGFAWRHRARLGGPGKLHRLRGMTGFVAACLRQP